MNLLALLGLVFPLEVVLSPLYFEQRNTDKLIEDIRSHKNVAKKIIDYVLRGKGKGQTYDRLADFVDTFDHMLGEMKAEGLDNVHGEDVTIPHWVRGRESASLLLPRRKPLAILGLGSSVGTPHNGVTADVLVVTSFKDLQAKAHLAKGKIVVYNQPYVFYGVSVAYRTSGASEAAKLGAVAALIRSVTPLSVYSPHTGWQVYQANVTKIPTACVTVEDAELMHRLQRKGKRVRVNLFMEAKTLPPVTSRNTVAEIKGWKYPDNVVLVSGHLDSWDVGQGAMDDGGGAFISYQALSVIRQLGLRPKRTMRVVLWTAEEPGLVGSQQYYSRHKHEVNNMDFVAESDEGTFTPLGLRFKGNAAAQRAMRALMTLLMTTNATALESLADGGDVGWFIRAGVPGASLANKNDHYFYYHHTNGDTMTVENSRDLDLCTAVWTVMAYVLADLEERLPR